MRRGTDIPLVWSIMIPMNRRILAVLFILCSWAGEASGQELHSRIADLGIKKLAYEVSQRVEVGGSDLKPDQITRNAERRFSRTPTSYKTVGSDIFVIDGPDAKPRKLVSAAPHGLQTDRNSHTAHGMVFSSGRSRW